MGYTQMVKMDQLTREPVLRDRFLPFYEEMPIEFPPTYKLALYGDEYSNKRIPGWTDRIFYRKGRCHQHKYACMYKNYGSDHRPILATYEIETEEGLSIFPD